MLFVEDLLEAAVSLETDSDNPVVLHETSLCADGMKFHPMCDLVETVGLGGMGETG